MSVVIIISVAVWTPFFVKIGGGLRFVGEDDIFGIVSADGNFFAAGFAFLFENVKIAFRLAAATDEQKN